jgi:hypothetical protein
MVTKASRLRALENQIPRLERCLRRLHRQSYRYSWIRFALFFATVLGAGVSAFFFELWLAGIWLVMGGALFGLSVYLHRRLRWSIRRHQLWLETKGAQIARARLDWERVPVTFHAQPDWAHPFERDLDLVGPRSVHRLLDTAVSYEGSHRLRAWLTMPTPQPQATLKRQQLVRELAPMHLFRDKLAVNAALAVGARRTWRASELLDWLERHGPGTSLRRWLFLSAAWVVLNAVLFVANRLGLVPAWWQVTLVLYLGFWVLGSRSLGAAWEEAMVLEGALRQLRVVFGQLEAFSYSRTPHLKALCEPFLDRAHGPSKYLARITRVVAALGVQGNVLVRVALNAVVPWDLYFAYRLDQTKRDIAPHVRTWMDTWFELEALASLANFAYLNHAYAFPDLQVGAPPDGREALRAEGLGHPLLPEEQKVCNDFEGALGQVAIITGSNMAGKSVFLKTVGVNLSLAYAGGPVNARRLSVPFFRLFTCMNISDSVTDGISYFYREVKRLKGLLDALQEDHALPLLFCIDEIFRGTNNRERLIGSQAYVRALAGKHGLGLIATHDLELANLEEVVPQVENYHFRDHVVGDRMAFDYVLRPGPSPTTNALRIMELEGLPVPVAAREAETSAADRSGRKEREA